MREGYRHRVSRVYERKMCHLIIGSREILSDEAGAGSRSQNCEICTSCDGISQLRDQTKQVHR